VGGLPPEAPDFETRRKKPGCGKCVLRGVEHAVHGEIMDAVLYCVPPAVAMAVEVGLAAGVFPEEVVESIAVPGAVGLLREDRVMAKDEDGFPGSVCFLKLGGEPGDLCIARPAVPALSVGALGCGEVPEFGLCRSGAGIVRAMAVGAYLGGVDDQKAEARLPDSVVGIAESEFGRHLVLEFFGDVKVMIAQRVMEWAPESGGDGLEVGKALEVTVDKIAEMKGEGEFVLVQFPDGLGEFAGALAIEAGADTFGICILAVGHETEGEERLFPTGAGGWGGTRTDDCEGGSGSCEEAAAGSHEEG